MVIEKRDEKRLTCCKTHKEKGADRRSTRTSHMVRNAKEHHFSETPINEEKTQPIHNDRQQHLDFPFGKKTE